MGRGLPVVGRQRRFVDLHHRTIDGVAAAAQICSAGQAGAGNNCCAAHGYRLSSIAAVQNCPSGL